MVLPPPMQSSLPAGWLAFTGRELNPLDRYKRFQIIHPPFLDLAWRKGSFSAFPSPRWSPCGDSFGLDVRRLDDWPPLLDFRLLKGAEGLRRPLLAWRNVLA